jgi:hypothetical protein
LVEISEECDPPGPGCSPSCLLTGSVFGQSLCGDGIIGLGEECDEGELIDVDGSTLPLDGDDFDSDGVRCSRSCQIENRDLGFCRDHQSNIFDFNLGSCSLGGSCPSAYDCVALNSVVGNTNTASVCGNGRIEIGEECDGSSHCTAQCLHEGYEFNPADPGLAGPYQVVKALANGLTYIQAWITSFSPAGRGPLGEARLLVGNILGEGEFGIVERWPDCSWACLNAAIGGRFSLGANPGTISDTDNADLVNDKIFLYECLDEQCLITDASDPIDISVIVDTIVVDQPNDTFRIYLPINYNLVDTDQRPETPLVPALLPNRWYRVVVRGTASGVLSSEGKTLSDLNFDDPYLISDGFDSHSWVFRTQPEYNLCGLETVDVIPEELALPEGDVRYRYFSDPRSAPDQCDSRGQSLNPYYFNWVWDTFELDGINGADLVEDGLLDGCGNGAVEFGEDCDPGLQSVTWCTAACRWSGLTACVAGENNCCGNGVIELGEACENPDGVICDSQCLLLGNTNTGQEVCGNGVIEEHEACDFGNEPNGDDSDGCTDICTFSGSIPGTPSTCGDGIIGLGEECDEGELSTSAPRITGDDFDGDGLGCTGYHFDFGYVCQGSSPLQPCNPNDDSACNGVPADCVADSAVNFTQQAECEQINIISSADNHLAWCSWTGSACQTRPCLLEDRDIEVCRSDRTNRFDFNQDPAACRSGYQPFNLSAITGNNNYGLAVCGNGVKEEGEACDDGNVTPGRCSVDGAACSSVGGSCNRTGSCNGNFCVIASGLAYPDDECPGGGSCTVGGSCISDGCSDICTFSSSAVADNLIDPYQIVETVPLGTLSALESVNEEIRAWSDQQPDRVGVGLLTVYSGANVPFNVIGRQPDHDINPAGDDLQCRNVALWAVFSKPLDKETIANNLTLEVCSLSGVGSYSSCDSSHNYITSYEYRLIYGQCLNNTCHYPDNLVDVNNIGVCQFDNECVGSQVIVTGLAGYCDDAAKTYCETNADCSSGVACLGVGFLAPQASYHLAAGTGLKSVANDSLTDCGNAQTQCSWNFSTSNDFCSCDYIGVSINYSSNGAETTKDLFTCATDNCGANTKERLDDDVSPANICTGGSRADMPCNSSEDCPSGSCGPNTSPAENLLDGNQHKYGATCYDINNTNGSIIPLSYTALTFNWFDIDPESLISLTALSPASSANHYQYVTPANKNGKSFVVTKGLEYICSSTGQLCNPASPSPCPAEQCLVQPASTQTVDVTNFICDNPWPGYSALNYIFSDGVGNCDNVADGCLDTNFSLMYCRDAGNPGFADDLPGFAYNSAAPTADGTAIRGQTLGTNVIKDFVFSVDTTNDAIGIKVLSNPLHLSPSTWYSSGLCGGSASSIDNVCFSDADCTAGPQDASLVGYWKFREGSGTVVNDSSGNDNHGTINGAEWFNYSPLAYALSFNRSEQDYISIPDDDILDAGTGDLSVSVWFRHSNNDATDWGDYLVHKMTQNDPDCTPARQGYHLGLFRNNNLADGGPDLNKLMFSFGRGGTTASCGANVISNNTYNDNQWHHAVGVAKRTNNGDGTDTLVLELYVDGELDRSQTYNISDSNFSNSNSQELRIGRGFGGLPTQQYWDGFVNEVRIYNRALTSLEVKLLAQRQERSCEFNIPSRGGAQGLTVDGYQAVKEGRTVYVGATNKSANLFSNIYLLSYSENASAQTQEIFNRILDANQQLGYWYFNDNINNYRICNSGIGYFDGTNDYCPSMGTIDSVCANLTTQASCESADNYQNHGCRWNSQLNTCQGLACQPIYCQSNFDCPNFDCVAFKDQIIRDAQRYGDLRDTQLALRNYYGASANYPTLASGTYIASTTFSVWPSWQQTLGSQLGGSLFTDPLNRLIGCTDLFCDYNENGQIDSGETDTCSLTEPTRCGNQPELCLPQDPDAEVTCWDELSQRFMCPAGAFVYGYYSTQAGQSYELYTNLEYSESSWKTALGTTGNPFYQLPRASFSGGTCELFNLAINNRLNIATVSQATCSEQHCFGGANNFETCDTIADCPDPYGSQVYCSGDGDFDGVCDTVSSLSNDNCNPLASCQNNPRSCYNPDQLDTNNNNLGNVCDTNCSSDVDGDGVCDNIDNCRTVYNPNQAANIDGDAYGDACDPCTDQDGDGWWDYDTGVNDERICPKDNCPSAANPLQEDYDNDGIGYACDACLDFDNDGLGDYTFFTHNPAVTTLTTIQDDHFEGCSYPFDSFNTNDLDNCPGGPDGAVCKDQFGITISCANPIPSNSWQDIYGGWNVNSQIDYDRDGIGHVCDPLGDLFSTTGCGDGIVDKSRGEVCDCGLVPTSLPFASRISGSSSSYMPWQCLTYNNNFPIFAALGGTPGYNYDSNIFDGITSYYWCANDCSQIKEQKAPYCGDGIPQGPTEKCDDGNQPVCSSDCQSVNGCALGTSIIQVAFSGTAPGINIVNDGADLRLINFTSGAINLLIPADSCTAPKSNNLTFYADVTTPPPQTGVIFVTDLSGSMDDDIVPGQTRLEAVQAVLPDKAYNLLDALPNSKIGFVSFKGSTANDDVSQQGLGCPNSLCGRSQVSAQQVRNLVNSYDASGGTPTSEGVTLAHNILNNDPSLNYKVMVILSDGAPTSGFDPLAQAEAARNQGIRIYTINFGGTAGNMQPWSSNPDIGDTTCDNDNYCYDSANLNDAYSRIIQNIIDDLYLDISFVIGNPSVSSPLRVNYDIITGVGNNYVSVDLPTNLCSYPISGGNVTVPFSVVNNRAGGFPPNMVLSVHQGLLQMCADCDRDNDGYYSQDCGGTDPDDNNPSILDHEICDDLIDNDGNGLVDDVAYPGCEVVCNTYVNKCGYPVAPACNSAACNNYSSKTCTVPSYVDAECPSLSVSGTTLTLQTPCIQNNSADGWCCSGESYPTEPTCSSSAYCAFSYTGDQNGYTCTPYQTQPNCSSALCNSFNYTCGKPACPNQTGSLFCHNTLNDGCCVPAEGEAWHNEKGCSISVGDRLVLKVEDGGNYGWVGKNGLVLGVKALSTGSAIAFQVRDLSSSPKFIYTEPPNSYYIYHSGNKAQLFTNTDSRFGGYVFYDSASGAVSQVNQLKKGSWYCLRFDWEGNTRYVDADVGSLGEIGEGDLGVSCNSRFQICDESWNETTKTFGCNPL